MLDKSKVKIGSDFEMFLVDKEGKVISAIPFNEGTKENSEKLDKQGCCISRDGILQECNLPPVGLDEADEFWSNIELVKDYVYTKFARAKGLTLKCCPTMVVAPDQLDNDEAKQAGCSVDFNAWRGADINDKPEFNDSGLRSAGFHIHISAPNCDTRMSIDLMKLFDLYLTVPFVLLDGDKERRQLYGKAGAFRICNYGEERGFEARTLSGICSEKQSYIDYIFNQLNLMFDHYNEFGTSKVDSAADKIVECINSSNQDLASEICKEFDLVLLIESEYLENSRSYGYF